jgi:hypothetical protein
MTIPDDDLPDPRTAELLRGVRREITPSRDLWPGIEGRLRRPIGRAVSARRRWMIGIAAAAAIFAGFLAFGPRTKVAPALAEAPQIQLLLAQTTGPHSATAKSLARHLDIVAQAIEETETALAETPGDPALTEFLQTLQRRQLALLAQAARFAAES